MNRIQISYKLKYRIAVCAIPIILCVIYFMAIQNTMNVYNLGSQLTAGKQQNAVSDFDWDVMGQKFAALNKVAPMSKNGQEEREKQLLSVLSQYASEENVGIQEIGSPVISKKSEFTAYTTSVKLQGKYSGIERLLYRLEQDKSIGKVTSISYQAFQDYHTGLTKLVCQVFFQNVFFNKSGS